MLAACACGPATLCRHQHLQQVSSEHVRSMPRGVCAARAHLRTGIRGLAAPSSWRRTTLQSGKAKQPVTVSRDCIMGVQCFCAVDDATAPACCRRYAGAHAASSSPQARRRTARLRCGTLLHASGAHLQRGMRACARNTLTRDDARCSTRLRSGAVGARVLRWSPLGNYLLVAGFDKRDFEIWETHSWCALGTMRNDAAPC